MTYHLLGSSQLNVSQVGFGCMSTGTDEPQAIALLRAAFGKGINYFDTADIYNDGINEIIVGTALRDIRHQVIIASKVGNVRRRDGSGLDWNPSKQHILASVEESLKRLQTDYLDLYQLHGGTITDPIDETIEAFEILQQQGKIRYYGISSIRPNVIREYVSRSSIASVMMQYSLLDRRPEEECLDLLAANRISALVRGSVAQGLLAGKPAKPYLDHNEPAVRRAAEAVASVSGAQKSAAQAAIQYTLQHPAVASAVVGIRTIDQLDDVAGLSAASPLTETEFTLLRRSAAQNRYKEHR